MSLHPNQIEILSIRVRTVLDSIADTAPSNLGIFFEYIEHNMIFRDIIDELIGDGLPDYQPFLDEINTGGRLNFPATLRDKNRICLSIIYGIKNKEIDPWNIIDRISQARNMDTLTQECLMQFFKPIYNYIVEKISEVDMILYMLLRYKIFTEWYNKELLFDLYSNNQEVGESILDRDIRKFLFLSGLDYPYSKPRSPVGETDILAIVKEKPIPLELKIFKGDNRDHIKNGFTQTLLYSTDYNSSIGYLVIFNVSDKELKFNLSKTEIPQRAEFSGKTIFLITVNIFPHSQPASKRKLDVYEIEEDYLTSR